MLKQHEKWNQNGVHLMCVLCRFIVQYAFSFQPHCITARIHFSFHLIVFAYGIIVIKRDSDEALKIRLFSCLFPFHLTLSLLVSLNLFYLAIYPVCCSELGWLEFNFDTHWMCSITILKRPESDLEYNLSRGFPFLMANGLLASYKTILSLNTFFFLLSWVTAMEEYQWWTI